MKFYIDYKDKIFTSQTYYLDDELSFYCEPHNNVDFSIVIGNSYSSLDLKIDAMNICQLTGINPKYNWIKRKLYPPVASQGDLLIESDEIIYSGMGIQILEHYNTYFDCNNGWICIGNNSININDQIVEFEKDLIAVVSNGNLLSIWVRPQFVNTLT